ncbi:MAG: toll/interleukin-1 receptor domain-containing protein [Bacteroidia bacterium]|nr:toll/interleukin-1 receptor domain-containing protein [Bacteroidia bacterium]
MTPPRKIQQTWKEGRYEQALTDLSTILDSMAQANGKWAQDAAMCHDKHRQWRAERLQSQTQGVAPSRELLSDIETWLMDTTERMMPAFESTSARPPVKGSKRGSSLWDTLTRFKDILIGPGSKPSNSMPPPAPMPAPAPEPPSPEPTFPEELEEMAMEESAPPPTPSSDHSFSPYAATYDTCDWVNVSLYSPDSVEAGKRFLITAFAHLLEQAEEVDRMAREADPEAVRQGAKTLSTAIERGEALQFHLQIEAWEVDEALQALRWMGAPNSAEFVVSVPANASGQAFGNLIVIGPKGPVGRISFNLNVGAAAPAGIFADTKVNVFHHTYLAYASQDEPAIKALEPAFQQAGWNWLPSQPGPVDILPDWEEEAFANIQKSELFVLFWSSAADMSDRVAAEWQVALAARLSDTDGLPDIMAVNVGADAPSPPQELSFLTFLPQFVAQLPPLPEQPTFTEDDATLRRLSDEYVASGDERVFTILMSRATGEDLNEAILLQNSWKTLRREERLLRITAEDAKVARVRLNSSILALVGRLF